MPNMLMAFPDDDGALSEAPYIFAISLFVCGDMMSISVGAKIKRIYESGGW